MATNTVLCFECPANLCCQLQRRLQFYKVTDILERPEINRATCVQMASSRYGL